MAAHVLELDKFAKSDNPGLRVSQAASACVGQLSDVGPVARARVIPRLPNPTSPQLRCVDSNSILGYLRALLFGIVLRVNACQSLD